MFIGAAFVTGVLIGAVTCGNTAVTPGFNDTLLGARGQCVFPSACYVVAKSGPMARQCADCSGRAESCRLRFIPGSAGAPALGDQSGVFVPALSDMGVGDGGVSVGPAPTDPSGVCSLYPSPDPAYEAICATAQAVCVARGPRCTGGSCIAVGGTCGMGNALPPQRKPGSSDGELYCPFADDICCPQPPPDAGALTDAGPIDAARIDAR